MKNKTLFVLSLILISLFLAIITFKRPMISNTSVWIHRGGVPANSKEGILDILNHKRYSFEIDVRLDQNTLKLSHDIPIAKNATLLKGIIAIPDIENIWVDFKEYGIIKLLKSPQNFKLLKDERVRVETKSLWVLLYFRLKGIQTFFWYNPERYRFSAYGFNYLLLSFLKVIRQHEISMDHRYINKYKLTDFNINTFTINSERELSNLCKLDNINIILTDVLDLKCKNQNLLKGNKLLMKN